MNRYNANVGTPAGGGRGGDSSTKGVLDPADWPAFRELAHEILDRALDLQQHVRDEPAWRPVPPELEPRYREGRPLEGIGERGAWEETLELVFPYRSGNIHPRFWGWVGGTGSPLGIMAELVRASLNNSAPFDDAASRIEGQLVDWMKEAMGFPSTASGVVTSGGSVANLIGMAVGRDARAGADVPGGGVGAAEGRIRVYASTEVHASVLKAAQVLGLGRRGVRLVGVDGSDRIRIDELRRRIEEDRGRGDRPAVIVGNAGTVNTGAIDDLEGLADVARDEGLWLHVDGAFGALARLSPEVAHRVAGLERADSVAFDFHKWMCAPYEAGCVLVRDREAHLATFSVPADYLDPPPRGTGSWVDSTNLKGLQLSRSFRSLKVWMTLKAYGFERFGALVSRNVEQARYLAGRIRRHPSLELVAPVALNVVCFRYVTEDLGDEELDALNGEILMRVQERGIAVPSSTRTRGRFALRCAIVNQRSRTEDFDLLVDAVARIGEEVVAGDRPERRCPV